VNLYSALSKKSLISLISLIRFYDFAFIVQFKHKQYMSSWLYFVCFYFTTDHFACMYFVRKCIIGPPTHSLGANIVLLVGVCRRLSSSVTLHGGPASGFTHAG